MYFVDFNGVNKSYNTYGKWTNFEDWGFFSGKMKVRETSLLSGYISMADIYDMQYEEEEEGGGGRGPVSM